MAIRILNNREKREMENMLGEQFGIEKIPGEIIRIGKERLFLFTGNLTKDEIKNLEKMTRIERIGAYFAKIIENKVGEKKVRLSIEGSQMLKGQIRKNVLEIPKDLAEEWMKGHEIYINAGKMDFFIMKHNDDFLGTGKASEGKIGNFIPKNRRLKERG